MHLFIYLFKICIIYVGKKFLLVGNSVPNCAATAGGLYAGVVEPHHLVHHRLRHPRQARLLPASQQTELLCGIFYFEGGPKKYN
jgi:hypothetical protein